jgi:hypothetical protein
MLIMFRKIVDVLKEVFWIKSSRKRRKPARRKTVSAKGGSASGGKRFSVKKRKPKKIPKSSAKQTAQSALKAIDPSLAQVGVITHYFGRIKVCVVKLTKGTVLIGDKLTIRGNKTKFVQKVWSMQIESQDVKVARKGQLIGLKVDKIVAIGDKVYK